MPQISFLPFLNPFPTSSRILLALFLTCSLAHLLLSRWDQARLEASSGERAARPGLGVTPWLVLVPGDAIPWFPWTFLTAGFVETKPLELLLSICTIPLCARYLERVWSLNELIRFSALVIVASNIIGFGFSWLQRIVLGQPEEFLYGQPIRGGTALLTGYLVAFTQLIPEHQVQLFNSRLKIRVKTIPGLFLLLSNVLTVVVGFFPWILIQFGFITSYWYLRFFQSHASELGGSEFRGDRSETFAFIYWLPPPVRPIISPVANLLFNTMVKIGVIQPWTNGQEAYGLLPTNSNTTSGTRAEAERRRALALKALDDRVASSSTPAPEPVAPSNAAPVTTTTASAAPEPEPPVVASSEPTTTTAAPVDDKSADIKPSDTSEKQNASSGQGKGKGKGKGKK